MKLLLWFGVLVPGMASPGCAHEPTIRGVTIRGIDYAFEIPDSLPSGQTAFAFENSGQVRHEVKVIALKPGITLAQVMRLGPAESNWSGLIEPASGILTADPGLTTPGRMLVDLQAGRTYVLVCGLQDTDSAPPHVSLGMVRAVRIY